MSMPPHMYPPADPLPPAKPKGSYLGKGCLAMIGCGAVATFIAGFLFFFVVLKTADKLSSPATIMSDRFLGHVCAGDFERAYDLMAPSYREENDLAAFTAELEDRGVSDCAAWDKGGAVWSSSGAVHVDVGVKDENGGRRDWTFTAAEIDGEWKILEIKPGPYDY